MKEKFIGITPKSQKTSETKIGEVFRTEYGDFDNFVQFVFEGAEQDETGGTKISVRYINEDKVFSVYSIDNLEKDTLRIVGYVEQLEEEVE